MVLVNFETKISLNEKKSLLAFVTGSVCMPLDGFDPPFHITSTESSIDSLPRAHTCFNQLIIPNYTSKKRFASKIKICF